MQSVYFCAGNTFATGDRMAAALLQYAGVLAETNGFDVVGVPLRRSDGSTGRVSLLLTPSSQISAESIPLLAGDIDPVDEELIGRMHAEMDRRLNPRYPQPETVPAEDSHFDF